MKKFVWVFSLLSSLFFFNSCDKKTEQHYTAIFYPTVKSFLYADQTLDSICFITLDAWQLTCGEGWLHIPEHMQGGGVPAGYFIQPSVPLTFDPNVTGESRTALVNLHANGNTLSVLYEQFPFLNVKYPARKDEVYELRDSAFITTDSLVFEAYGTWTLEFVDKDAGWISWEDASLTRGSAGRQIVAFNMQENRLFEERKMTARLTSNGVSGDIIIVQLPVKQENSPQK